MFDEKIKKEIEKIDNAKSEEEKLALQKELKQKNYLLRLNTEARDVLNELEKIQCNFYNS